MESRELLIRFLDFPQNLHMLFLDMSMRANNDSEFIERIFEWLKEKSEFYDFDDDVVDSDRIRELESDIEYYKNEYYYSKTVIDGYDKEISSLKNAHKEELLKEKKIVAGAISRRDNLENEMEFIRFVSEMDVREDAEYYYLYSSETGDLNFDWGVFLTYSEALEHVDRGVFVGKFSVRELRKQVKLDCGLAKRSLKLCKLLLKRFEDESALGSDAVKEIRLRSFATA